MVSLCFAGALISVVNAFSVTYNLGFFTNDYQTGIGYGDVIKGGIPTSESKDVFINTILGHLNGSTSTYDGKRARTGAAFIIQTMRGGNPGDSNSRPSTSDIDDWKARINNPAVVVEYKSYVYPFNSGYTGDKSAGASGDDDDAYYPMINSASALLFKVNGVVQFAIKTSCGNPVGGLLPPAGWTIKPESTADRTTAQPGDKITWAHKITNNGPEKTNAVVNYYYHNSQDLGTDYDSNKSRNLLNGSVANASVLYQSTYTVKSSDLGKTLCRSTFAKPGGKNNNPATVESEPACVTISATPTSNKCRPITIEIKDPYWPSSTDYNGDPISVTVYVYKEIGQNTNTYASSLYKKYTATNMDKLDVTKDLTTGDRYKVSYKTEEYVYDAEYDGYGDLEYYMYTHNEWTYPSGKYSGSQPIGPCFDYSLTSSVKDLGYYQLEVGSKINITPLLASDSWTKNNLPSFYSTYLSGGLSTPLHTKTKKSKWQISQLIVEPGNDVPSVANTSNSTEPCTYYREKPGVAGCESLFAGSDTVFNIDASFMSGGDNPLTAHNLTIPDYPAGTKICYTFSTYPSASDPKYYSFEADNIWNHSAVNPSGYSLNTSVPIVPCVIIVKKPKVQVTGGDLVVGRTSGGSGSGSAESMVYTTISDKGNLYGSWGEYGIFATGSITGMASGSAFARPFASKQICSYSTLTFHNTKTGDCTTDSIKGNYKQARNIADVAASFTGVSKNIDAPSISPSSFFSSSGLSIGYRSGDLTLSESELAAGEPGQSVVLKVDGNVLISGDQIYEDASYTGISQLPQLVIIASKDITISSNVSRVDAWLVSGGAIRTCGIDPVYYDKLTISTCNEPLTINGPVMANKLYLLRTAGSGPGDQSGDPAEIFNLRADAYLWSFARASTSGRVQTVYTTELPPRF